MQSHRYRQGTFSYPYVTLWTFRSKDLHLLPGLFWVCDSTCIYCTVPITVQAMTLLFKGTVHIAINFLTFNWTLMGQKLPQLLLCKGNWIFRSDQELNWKIFCVIFSCRALKSARRIHQDKAAGVKVNYLLWTTHDKIENSSVVRAQRANKRAKGNNE